VAVASGIVGAGRLAGVDEDVLFAFTLDQHFEVFAIRSLGAGPKNKTYSQNGSPGGIRQKVIDLHPCPLT